MQKSTRKELAIRNPEIRELTKQIIFHHERFAKAGCSVITMMQAGLWHRYQAGKRLNQVKAIVGHGDWLFYLEANLPFDQRTAQRYMEIDNRHPELRNTTAKSHIEPDLKLLAKISDDIQRKHAIAYVPEKGQPEHKGNIKLDRSVNCSNISNEFDRIEYRHVSGLQLVDFDEAREEFKRFYLWLRWLYGDSEENPWLVSSPAPASVAA